MFITEEDQLRTFHLTQLFSECLVRPSLSLCVIRLVHVYRSTGDLINLSPGLDEVGHPWAVLLSRAPPQDPGPHEALISRFICL